MKLSLNTFLGIGGIISMIASPILAFSGIKTDVEVNKTRISSLEKMQNIVNTDHDLIIAIATKLNVDTTKILSAKP